jgi:peptidoglycan/LPS O-acetylase OafA/YrhL
MFPVRYSKRPADRHGTKISVATGGSAHYRDTHGGAIGMAPVGSRSIGIDVLRAVAILTVIGLHWVNSNLAASAAAWPGIEAAFVKVADHGTYGVTLFFVISGFLITRTTMLREPDLFALSARSFYIRRIARIQPLYVAIVVFGLVMVLAGGDTAQHIFYDPKAAYDGEFLAGLFSFTYNWEMILRRNDFMFRGVHWDVLWSLAVEEQFYLLFPLLLLWAKSAKRLYAALWGVVAVGIAPRVICDAAQAGLLVKLFNSFSCFDTLALGVLCALLGDRLPHGRALCLAAIAAGTAAIAWAFYHGGVAPLILGALLFIHGTRYVEIFAYRGRAAPWAAPLARLGQLSYGLYLLHATALYLAAPALAGLNRLLGFALVVAVAYGLAEIVWRCYEAPANTWIRAKLLRPRRATGLAPAPAAR